MSKQVAVSLSPELEKAVDQWRLSLVVPPSKSAAMAALVAAGLRVMDQAPAGNGGAAGMAESRPLILRKRT